MNIKGSLGKLIWLGLGDGPGAGALADDVGLAWDVAETEAIGVAVAVRAVAPVVVTALVGAEVSVGAAVGEADAARLTVGTDVDGVDEMGFELTGCAAGARWLEAESEPSGPVVANSVVVGLAQSTSVAVSEPIGAPVAGASVGVPAMTAAVVVARAIFAVAALFGSVEFACGECEPAELAAATPVAGLKADSTSDKAAVTFKRWISTGRARRRRPKGN